jgi:hypothetical protein
MKNNAQSEKKAFVQTAVNLQKFTRHLAVSPAPFTSQKTKLSEVFLLHIKLSRLNNRA